MVEKSVLEQKYGDVLEKINLKKDKEKKCSRTVELFFSFDIVNSSAYKDSNYYGWQVVLTRLLANIQGNVTKSIPEAQLWRVFGDEMIFFVTIHNVEEIYSCVDSIYSVLFSSNAKLRNGSFFDEIEKECDIDEAKLMKDNNILAVQAASWLAVVMHGEECSFQSYDNLFIKYSVDETQKINEFLGQDIDIGFRIKKETQDRRLVVSIELAKILSDKTEYLPRLKIVTYKSLKGVWKNRLYPIIWYYNKEISGDISFEESFYYDETTFSQLSKEYFVNRESNKGNLASYMFSDVYHALNKVIKDQQLEGKVRRICEVIEETESDEKVVENEFGNKLLEFHCAAVCCNIETKRILIAKRKNRKFLTGLWEFGCAKANTERGLSESISMEYKNDFGIDIDVIYDESREDLEPRPIALYQVEKVEKLQKGVIVVAKIVGGLGELDNTIKNKGKHEEYRWISEEEIDGFNEPAIDDFKDTLKKVFNLWNDFFRE